MPIAAAPASIEPLQPSKFSDDPLDLGRLPIAAVALVFLPIALSEACIAVLKAGGLSLAHVRGEIIYLAANLATVVPLVLVARRRGISTRAFGWHRPNLSDLVLGAAGFVYGAVVAYNVAVAINNRLGTPIPTHFLYLDLAPLPLLVRILYALVVAPFCEETLFRGFAIPRLMATGLRPFWAGAISLAAFSAMHLPWVGIGGAIFIFLWGTAPTALYLWRGNIAASTTMHVLNNLWVFFILAVFLKH